MRKLHLLSNAHLDPSWQWEWEEGAAAAVSTFRAAADFCEEYDGYVFNHNEAILYKWIEEYEPHLFERIQRLVREGKWNIMGGWYLQPDCNMPSGESFVRQILTGRLYFSEKFGARPTTAINFDSFGHTRGLVQILQKAGYDSYIFMRPENRVIVPGQNFIWEGYAGSSVMAHQIADGYSTLLGKAHEKIGKWIKAHPETEVGLILWGVGNHGGGPSRLDLDAIAKLMEEVKVEGVEVSHSTPEHFFAELKERGELPVYDQDLNPRFVGCYTSMIQIKQKHRQLENQLFMTEKMLAAAEAQGLLRYPKAELDEAVHDLMYAQFHDILPGTSIQAVEDASLRLLEHGLEILARLRTRAFFALSAGQPKAKLKEYPVLVYNPHPYPVRQLVECEFMLEDQNWEDYFSVPVVYQGEVRLPSQTEKEQSNLNLDWRKRVVFEAELAPSSMNRFDCRIERADRKPEPELKPQDGKYVFENGRMRVVISTLTGLVEEYVVDGQPLLRGSAFLPLVMADNEDPWRMDTDSFRDVVGSFTLMNPGQGTDFSGVKQALLPSVRVIEDGEVRTVIEAVLHYNHSYICQTYKLPKQGTEIEVNLRVYWNEKDKMLKLSVPTALADGRYRGQTAFGISELAADGTETVAQRWMALEGTGGAGPELAVTLINDGIYGSDCRDGEVRLSLLRGAGYCAHPIGDKTIMPQDRFLPRIDQGERQYTFWLNGGPRRERMARVDREALAHGERPYALSFFPSGEGQQPGSFIRLQDEVVQLSAFKKAEQGESYILRLFEPTGEARKTTLEIPSHGISAEIQLEGFEIKTLAFDPAKHELREAELCEGL
ncbi:glycoside hydrolase family 38 C-terminal domain-containing protein [Paenibacillus physcomitrellae]|uniref:Alpha-mannosidase n=1 Tax=Paenibacillus physcomitrellae TaxID=1619311 RepID=A0ABQ1GG36_9BACL|nr:alpha-mannosidase [Paenibacillus physcomitrellae]GGA42957.1 alpha-mannosidase [Paenibacillus physcomitrellae]